jgi:IS605 OrfB family transposase
MSAPGHDVEVPWTLPALRREWNRAKDQVAPWWRANSKEAYNSGLDALARALKNWSDSKAGRRKGPKVGFPQFKGKHRTRPACRFTTGPIRLEPDRHHVILPRLGRIRTHESTRKLARRHGPRASNGTRGTPSAGWQHTKQRLARAHARVANLRRDGLHKLTSDLARCHDTIVVEHLNVTGMLHNRRLARRIADAGWGELRRQLTYKTVWAGARLVQADPFYPSSKTCSACGAVKAKLPLSVRVFCCENCGVRIDRDLNAARNLAALVNEMVAGSGPETGNARGADRKTRLGGQVATKREPRTSRELGKTGTVGWQRPAAQITETR